MKITLDTPFVYGAIDKILLDGIQQTACIAADDIAGTLERYKTDKAGKLLKDPDNPDELLLETVTGKVEIKLNLGWSWFNGGFRINPVVAGTHWNNPNET